MQVLRKGTGGVSLVFGPFVDATDGSTIETGLAATLVLKLSKNGNEFDDPNDTGGWEYLGAGGMYGVGVNGTDTNTAGRLDAVAYAAGARPIARHFQVVEQAVYDALYATGAAGLAAVSADEVDTKRTWHSDGHRAKDIVELAVGFTGTLAFMPQLNPSTTIATVTSVTLSGPASVSTSALAVNRAKTKAHFDVPALATAGTYTVTATVTTVDSQTIVTTGTLRVV